MARAKTRAGGAAILPDDAPGSDNGSERESGGEGERVAVGVGEAVLCAAEYVGLSHALCYALAASSPLAAPAAAALSDAAACAWVLARYLPRAPPAAAGAAGAVSSAGQCLRLLRLLRLCLWAAALQVGACAALLWAAPAGALGGLAGLAAAQGGWGAVARGALVAPACEEAVYRLCCGGLLQERGGVAPGRPLSRRLCSALFALSHLGALGRPGVSAPYLCAQALWAYVAGRLYHAAAAAAAAASGAGGGHQRLGVGCLLWPLALHLLNNGLAVVAAPAQAALAGAAGASWWPLALLLSVQAAEGAGMWVLGSRLSRLCSP
eukprot:m51a1_g8530 hypothetical protein (322) ;mRNA; f:149317-150420